MYKKLLSCAVALALCALNLTVALAEDVPTVITPATGNSDVSVVADVVATYAAEVTDSMLTDAKVTVAPEAEYTKYADGNSIVVRFDSELLYSTEYTVTVDGVSTTFTTETENSDILYQNDFTNDTAGQIPSSMTQYGPECAAGAAAVMDSLWFTRKQSALVFGGGTANKFANVYVSDYTQGAGRAMINGSENWSDIEIDYDFGMGVGTGSISSAVMFRMTNDGGVYNGGATETIVQNQQGTYTMLLNHAKTADNARIATWSAGEYATLFSPFTTEKMYTQQFHMNVKVQGDSWTSTVTEKASGKVIGTATKSAAGLPAKGAVVFGSNCGYNTFDNIVIRDIGFGCQMEQSKNIQNKAVINFDEVINPATFSNDKITVMRDGQVVVGTTAQITGSQGKQVAVTIPDAADGFYTITVDKSIDNRKGVTMMTNKSFEVLVTMPYSFSDKVISDLKGGNTVSASVKINHSTSAQQEYTLVLAVYTPKGFLYDVSFDNVRLAKETKGYELSAQTEKALPEDATGYTAAMFILDNLENISPLSGRTAR